MQETANKQKRITLKTVHEMLNGMSVELAEKVHLLFMANYIDYSDYDFRDENQVESYCWCYRDLFELKKKGVTGNREQSTHRVLGRVAAGCSLSLSESEG